MAPEQARAESVDHRSDLFSLGSTLYAMCAGYPPFRAESAVAILRRVSDDTPRPLREVNANVPDWLETIIARLHAKDPGERYQSAAEVADILSQCLGYLQRPTTLMLPPTLSAKPKRGRLRARAWRWIVAGIFLISGAVALLLKLPKHQDSEAVVANGESETQALAAPPIDPATQPRIQRVDEIDGQILVLRQRAGTIEAELTAGNGSNSRDRLSEEIRNALMGAQNLEREIRSTTVGSHR
jgi:serine/threonine protein kinase